jgi:hypothetical protein
MNERKGNWYLITGLIMGLMAGLFISLFVSPVNYVDMDPASLSEAHQDEYRSIIALAYNADHDLGRAQGRMGLLGSKDPAQALAAQAQRMMAENQSPQTVRALALLAADLSPKGSTGEVSLAPTQPATVPPEATASSTPLLPTEVSPSPTSQPQASATPAATATVPSAQTTVATQRPVATAQPPLEAAFVLKSKEEICDGSVPAGLLQVEVYDENGNPMPGVEITVSWEDGEESFYTGLAPEVNPGYADYYINTDKELNLTVGQNRYLTREPITLKLPICPSGGWKFHFEEGQ